MIGKSLSHPVARVITGFGSCRIANVFRVLDPGSEASDEPQCFDRETAQRYSLFPFLHACSGITVLHRAEE